MSDYRPELITALMEAVAADAAALSDARRCALNECGPEADRDRLYPPRPVTTMHDRARAEAAHWMSHNPRWRTQAEWMRVGEWKPTVRRPPERASA